MPAAYSILRHPRRPPASSHAATECPNTSHVPPCPRRPVQGFENRRHLLRLWLASEDARPSDPAGGLHPFSLRPCALPPAAQVCHSVPFFPPWRHPAVVFGPSPRLPRTGIYKATTKHTAPLDAE